MSAVIMENKNDGAFSEVDGVICCTALYLATNNGHKEIVKYISQLPVNSNKDTLFKLTATTFAALNGNADIIRCIFPNHFANLEDIDETLEEASSSNVETVDDEITDELIAAVKNLNEKFMTAKKVKLNYGKLHQAFTVMQTDDEERNVEGGNFATIFEAAEQGDKLDLEKILENGTDVNICDGNKNTALHLAAAHGNVDNVEFLIEHGAQLKAKNIDLNTPFHVSAKFGHVQVVKHFLKMEIFIDVKNRTGTTALHLACENGHVDVSALLLLKKTNTNCVDNNGNTPLHCATLNNHAAVVQLLIQTKVNVKNLIDVVLQRTSYGILIYGASQLLQGVQINIKNKDGNTPLHLAAQNTNKHTARLLLEQNADVNAVNNNMESVVDCIKDKEFLLWILKFTSNFNFVDKFKNTLLHRAIEFRYLELVDLLLKNKVAIDAKNVNNETPLHMASKIGNCNIMEKLLRLGANIESCDKNNCSPIHVAVNNEHVQAVELLLEKGANVNAHTRSIAYSSDVNCDLTPLICAVKTDNLEIVELLLAYGADRTILGNLNKRRCNSILDYNRNAQQAIIDLINPPSLPCLPCPPLFSS